MISTISYPDLTKGSEKKLQKFFYPENRSIDFKSDSFRTFVDFADKNDFDSEAEKMNIMQERESVTLRFLWAPEDRPQ